MLLKKLKWAHLGSTKVDKTTVEDGQILKQVTEKVILTKINK